jgi:hypothetical protein
MAEKRKREAPTIDLKAKDVTPPVAAPEPPHQSAQATPHETPKPKSEAAAAAPREEAVEQTPPPEQPPLKQPGGHWVGLLAAGVAGGVVVAAVLGALWTSGVLPIQTTGVSDNSAQLAALQQQVQSLQSQALQNQASQSRTAPAADTRAVDALNQRVVRIEDALKTLPKGDSVAAERLTAAENAMKSLGVALAALNQRSDDATANAARARTQADAAEKAVAQLRGSVQDVAKDASAAITPAQIEALTQRLAALEAASKAARDDLNKTTASDKAARLALSAAALRAAVTGGAPFATELAQAKALGADENYILPLTPFAAAGVPSAAALAQELRALLPQLLKLSGAAPSGTFLDRLQANASKLVRVTPVDAPAGDDASAVLARLEVETAHADIAGALADLAKLPDATRAPAQAWIAKAKAREAALASVRDFAADAARALGSR